MGSAYDGRMDTVQVIAALSAVIVAELVPLVTMTIYFGRRIDRIADRMGERRS